MHGRLPFLLFSRSSSLCAPGYGHLKACSWQIKIGNGRKWIWCMCGWSKEKGCGANDAFPFWVLYRYYTVYAAIFPILYCICSRVSRPFIVKMMKVCAMQTWLPQFIQSERLNTSHQTLAYLCFNILESVGHISWPNSR